ncbi:porin [bacterium]|nr:MAG: porin [bacterium]
MKTASRRLTALIVFVVIGIPAVASEDPQPAANFGSPDAVENQIADDAATKPAALDQRLLQPWFDWKAGLQEKHGFGLGMDYSTVLMKASEDGASGEDAGTSGMFRIFGAWELLGRGTPNSGAFVWKVESRHKYGAQPPADLEFDLGGIGIIEPPFSNQGGRVTNLYWRQRLGGGKVTIVGGFLDATDYFDMFALASPWTGFMNFAFITGTTAAFLPNDATLGLAAGAMLSEKIYAIGGLTNAWADSRVPFRGFETFGDGEYFKSLEIGLTPGHERIYFDNTHVTVWHVDESDLAGTPGGWGLNFQYVRYLHEKWMPFVRAGWADEGGSLMEQSVSAGFGYQAVGSRDLLGFAANWGKPNESTWGSDLSDQYTLEVFYRFQISEQLAITPDLQFLMDPPNNPDHDSIWMYGIRARLAL